MDSINLLLNFQNNVFPERNTVYDFCFEKKASGHWIDWMDTIDKASAGIPKDAKVSRNIHFLYNFIDLVIIIVGKFYRLIEKL